MASIYRSTLMNRYTPNGDVPRSPWTDWSSQWPAASASCARWEDPPSWSSLWLAWLVERHSSSPVCCLLWSKSHNSHSEFPIANIRCCRACSHIFVIDVKLSPIQICYITPVKWCSNPTHYVHFILYILDLCSSRLVSFWVANAKFRFSLT